MPRLVWVAATLFAAFSVSPLMAEAAGPNPLGQWQVTTGEARYSVTACAGGLCAKLVWLRMDARTAANLALLNHYLVRGAQQLGANVWEGHVDINGSSYDGKMTMVGRDFMRLQACSGVLCQTFEFTRP